MTAKEVYRKYNRLFVPELEYPGSVLDDLWEAVKHEAAPLDAERVQVRLKELAEWFEDPNQSPSEVQSMSGFSAGYLLREIAARLGSVMAEHQREKGTE
jgi:hypothetical protein